MALSWGKLIEFSVVGIMALKDCLAMVRVDRVFHDSAEVLACSGPVALGIDKARDTVVKEQQITVTDHPRRMLSAEFSVGVPDNAKRWLDAACAPVRIAAVALAQTPDHIPGIPIDPQHLRASSERSDDIVIDGLQRIHMRIVIGETVLGAVFDRHVVPRVPIERLLFVRCHFLNH